MFQSSSIITIIGILIIGYILYKWWTRSAIDTFDTESSSPSQQQTTSNMITNYANFEEGKKPNIMYLNGTSTISTGDNPGKTSYYLTISRQGPGPGEEDRNYAGIQLNITNHTNYLFTCLCATKNPILAGTINPNGLVTIAVRTGTGSLIYPDVYYTTTPLTGPGYQQGVTWYKLEFVINMEVDGPATVMLEIFLGRNASQEIRMFTDLFLGQQITGLGPIPTISNLTGAYLAYSPASYLANGTTWKDLSGKGYDMTFDMVPNYNTQEKAFDMKTATLTGPLASSWIGSETDFTLVLYGKSLADATAAPVQALTVPGNNVDAVKWMAPNDSSRYPMQFVVADLKGPDMLAQLNQTYVMFIEYTQADTTCRITLNDADAPSFQFNTAAKVYGSTTRNVVINGEKHWNSLLYGVLVYQQTLSTQQKKDINAYMRSKETGSLRYPPSGYTKYDPIPIQKPTPDQLCNTTCSTRCESKIGNKGEYDQCMQRCGTEVPECADMCKLPEYGISPICRTMQTNYQEIAAPDCPSAIYRDGNYIILIGPGSKYAKQMRRSGEISYGSDKQKAAYMYSMNFQGCALPEALQAFTPPTSEQMEACPFNIQDNNPCSTDACNSARWSSGIIQDGMADQCKRNVNHYCELYHNIDPSCRCWDPAQRNSDECRRILTDIQQPYGEQCKAGLYPITQHPDISQYIRKDKIPCWGCNIK